MIMGETDKDLVFSESVKAGKRIYYFDVKQSRNGDRYIAITESKKINEGTFENPRFVFEKHKLFLYKEDYEKFVDALTRTLEIAKGNAPALQTVESAVETPVLDENVAVAVESPTGESEVLEEKAEKKGTPIVRVFSNFYTGFGAENDARGFYLDRSYIGYDYKLTKELSVRGVLDVGKSNNVDDYQRIAYIKNALITWKKNKFTLNGGLISTTQFNFQEKFWR
jgi:hypothetical protein